MDDTRSAIMAAGRELFATRGYAATSIRDIVRKADVNLGAITYHFGSKQNLFQAVIEDITAPLRERLEQPLAEGNALELLEAYLRGNWQFFSHNPDLPRIILHVLASAGTPPAAGLKLIRLNLKTVMTLIKRGQTQGCIRKGNPRHIAMAVAGQTLILGFYRRALVDAIRFDPFGRSRNAVIDDIVRFVRNGLAEGRHS